jgi:hypothetical protein
MKLGALGVLGLLALTGCSDSTGALPTDFGVYVRVIDRTAWGSTLADGLSAVDSVLEVQGGYVDIAVHGTIRLVCGFERAAEADRDVNGILFAWRAKPTDRLYECPGVTGELQYVAFIHGLVSGREYHLRVIYDPPYGDADSLKYTGVVQTGQRPPAP